MWRRPMNKYEMLDKLGPYPRLDKEVLRFDED